MQKGRHTAIIATRKYTNTTEQRKQSLKSESAKPKKGVAPEYIFAYYSRGIEPFQVGGWGVETKSVGALPWI